MQNKFRVRYMRIFVQMVDAVSIEQRRSAFDAVDGITFAEQQLAKVGTVLSSYARNEGYFILRHKSIDL
jgi:hypothetical protein